MNGIRHPHVEGENYCKSKEFIKLYVYTLKGHSIFVHGDLDVTLLKPLDDLYDAMFTPGTCHMTTVSPTTAIVVITSTSTFTQLHWCVFMHDVMSSAPWEAVQAIQGGFLVAWPSLNHFEMYQQLILQANYLCSHGLMSGWGNMVCTVCVSHRINSCKRVFNILWFSWIVFFLLTLLFALSLFFAIVSSPPSLHLVLSGFLVLLNFQKMLVMMCLCLDQGYGGFQGRFWWVFCTSKCFL